MRRIDWNFGQRLCRLILRIFEAVGVGAAWIRLGFGVVSVGGRWRGFRGGGFYGWLGLSASVATGSAIGRVYLLV